MHNLNPNPKAGLAAENARLQGIRREIDARRLGNEIERMQTEQADPDATQRWWDHLRNKLPDWRIRPQKGIRSAG